MFEFSWSLDLTKIKEPIIASPPTISVHLSMTSTGATVDFADYDPMDPRIDRIRTHAADDIEAVIVSTSHIHQEDELALRLLPRQGGEDGGAQPRPARASVGSSSEGLRREHGQPLPDAHRRELRLHLPAGRQRLIALLIVQALALFFSDRLVMGAGAVRPTKDQPEVTIVTVLSTPEAIRSLSTRGNQVMRQIREEFRKTVFAGNVESPETKVAVHGILVRGRELQPGRHRDQDEEPVRAASRPQPNSSTCRSPRSRS